MAKAFIIPTVVTKKLVNFSLEEMGKRLKQGPNVVRVGLPDSASTAGGNVVHKTRASRKGKRT